MPKYRNGVLNDVKTMIAAGFDPMTGLPINFAKQGMTKPQLKNNIKIALRILDEQNAVNRYEWYNLPDGLDGELLETPKVLVDNSHFNVELTTEEINILALLMK